MPPTPLGLFALLARLEKLSIRIAIVAAMSRHGPLWDSPAVRRIPVGPWEDERRTIAALTSSKQRLIGPRAAIPRQTDKLAAQV
jgi:hypothetical protein